MAEQRALYEADVDLLRLASELVVDAVVEPERAPRRARRAGSGSRRARTVHFSRAGTACPRSEEANRAVNPYLSDEHDALRDGRARLRPPRDRAQRRGMGPRPHLPGRHRPADGRARAVRHPVPRALRRGGGDLTGLCVAIEEIAWSDQSLAITLEAGVGLGANPIASFGTEAQKERWLPDLCAGRALGRLRADRARRRQRRRGHPHHAPCSTRRPASG